MKNFIIIMTLLLTASVYAQEKKTPNSDECGMLDGKVIPFDSTICKDDKAWNIMSSMLPKIYSDTAGIVSLDIGTPDEKIDLTLGVSDVFIMLYDFMFEISMWVMAIVLCIYAIDLISKYIKTGKIMQYQGFSAGKLAAGGMTSIGLLLPYQYMFLGQILVFSMSLTGPGFANMAHSAFLSNQESTFAGTLDATLKKAAGNTSNLVITRHTYQAREFYTYLTYMEMCRRITSAEILSDMFIAGEPISPQWDCIYGQQTTLEETTENVPSFTRAIGIDRVEFGSVNKSVFSNVGYSWELNKFPQCSFLSTVVTAYGCGGIVFGGVNWHDNPYSEVVSPETMLSVLSKINSNIRVESQPSQIKKNALEGWSTIYDEILNHALRDLDELETDQILTINNANAEFDLIEKRKAFEIVYRSKNQDILKRFAAMYFRSVMNSLYVGHVLANDNGRFIQTEVNQLQYHNTQSQDLANVLEDIFCINAMSSKGESEAALRLLKNNTVSASKVHFRCIDRDSMTVRGVESRGPKEEREAYAIRLSQSLDKLKIKYGLMMDEKSNYLASRRIAVESAYIKAVSSFQEPNITKKLRQEGFLSVAHYAFTMNQMYENTRDGVRYVVNHYELLPNQVTNTGVSQDVLGMLDAGSSDYRTDEIVEIMDSTQGFLAADPIIVPIRFINSTASQVANQNIRESSFDDLMKSVLFIFGGDFFDEFGSYGLSKYQLTDDQVKKDCMDNVEKCPFPVKDPFVSLNLLGHDMVNAGAQLIVMSVSARLIHEVNIRKKGKGGSVGKKSSLKDKVVKTTGAAAAISGAATSSFYLMKESGFQGLETTIATIGGATIMSMLASEYIGIIFMVALMITIVGTMLAYVMPLIPFVFVYYNFIAWLCIVVMASFSVFLYAVYLFRANEQSAMLKKTLVNYGTQIWFRLVFQYVALIFAWYLFYATTYFIANTFAFALPDFTGMGMATFLSGIMSWLMIAFVFFFGVTMSFSVVEEFTGEMFKKMGLDYKDSKDRVSEVVQAVLFDQAQYAGQKAKGAISKPSKSQNLKAKENLQKYQEASNRLKEMGDR